MQRSKLANFDVEGRVQLIVKSQQWPQKQVGQFDNCNDEKFPNEIIVCETISSIKYLLIFLPIIFANLASHLQGINHHLFTYYFIYLFKIQYNNMAVSHKNLKKSVDRSTSKGKSHLNPYCGACTNNRCHDSGHNSKPKGKGNLQKLMNAIQSFHNNLCSLPLDTLINSTHPQVWVQEQNDTCKQLQEKLLRMMAKEKDGGRRGNLEYYMAKMDSVKMVLANITNNMRTLRGIFDQQLLSEYNSTRTSNSRTPNQVRISDCLSNSSSKQQLQLNQTQISLSNFQLHRETTGQKNDNQRFKRQQSLYEIGGKSSSSASSNNIKNTDAYTQALNKYQKTLKNLRKGSFSGELTNKIPQFNKQNQQQYSNKAPLNLYTCQSQQQQLDEKKIIQIEQGEDTMIQSPNIKTKRLPNKMMPNQSNIFKNDSIKLTTAKQKHSQLQDLLHMMNSINYNNIQTQTNTINSAETSMHQVKHLLEEIVEYKNQLIIKNKQIQKILACQQELETVVELLQTEVQSYKDQNKFSSERIQNLETLLIKKQQQLGQGRDRENSLQCTVKNQAASMLSLQQQKQQLQWKLELQCEQSAQIRKQIENLKQGFMDEIIRARKDQKVAKQKMEIYKQRYYQVVQGKEISKIGSRQTYEGRAGKIKQINWILQEHRRNLQNDQIPVSVIESSSFQ